MRAATVAGLVLSFIVCFILLVITPILIVLVSVLYV